MEKHKKSRLKSLKTKEKQLINESENCNSLINQVLLQVQESIKKLEAQDNKHEFRSLYLTTLYVADKLNQLLVKTSLELEDFFSETLIDDATNESIRCSSSNKGFKKTNNDLTTLNTSTESFHIFEQPAALSPILNRQGKKPTTVRTIENFSVPFAPPLNRKGKKTISTFQENFSNQNDISPKAPRHFQTKSIENVESFQLPRDSFVNNNLDTEMNISIKAEVCETNEDMEISKQKVYEFLLAKPKNYPRRKFSEQKRAIRLGAPGFKESKFRESNTRIIKHFVNSTDSYNEEEDYFIHEQGISQQQREDVTVSGQRIANLEVIQSDLTQEEIPVKECHEEYLEDLDPDNERQNEDIDNVLEFPPKLIEKRFSDQTAKLDASQPHSIHEEEIPVKECQKGHLEDVDPVNERENADICKTLENPQPTLIEKEFNSQTEKLEVSQPNFIHEEESPVKECSEEYLDDLNLVSQRQEEEIDNVLESQQSKLIEKQIKKISIIDNDRCIVTHAVSPECFYIITASATENILHYDSFHEELQAYCDGDIARKYANKKEILSQNALFYCCYNELEDLNFTWFRCEIIDWLMDKGEEFKNTVRVLAVDDGFEKNVSIDLLRDYPDTVNSLPKMAVKCKLRNVYPPNSTKENILQQWPQNSIDLFNNLIQDSRRNPFYVTDITELSQCCEVELYNNKKVSLSNVMVQLKVAVIIELPLSKQEFEIETIKSEFIKEQIKRAQGLHNMQDSRNALDNLDDCVSNLDEAICDHLEGGYQPKDYARLCRFTKVDGKKCFKGDNCQFEHKLHDPDGWTTDKVEVYTATLNEIEQPNIGDRLEIIVTMIKTVCRFYAHIKLPKQKREMYQASKIIYTAHQFSKYINKPENLNGLKKYKILPAIGELVLVQSKNDKKWYRGRVITINSEDNIEVFFIDYGDMCNVKFNDLRELKMEHLGLPEQAVEFRIASIDPMNSTDPESVFHAANHLAEIILDRRITAYVVNNGYPIEAEIYRDDGVNIGTYLKMQNMAKDRDLSLVPKLNDFALE